MHRPFNLKTHGPRWCGTSRQHSWDIQKTFTLGLEGGCELFDSQPFAWKTHPTQTLEVASLRFFPCLRSGHSLSAVVPVPGLQPLAGFSLLLLVSWFFGLRDPELHSKLVFLGSWVSWASGTFGHSQRRSFDNLRQNQALAGVFRQCEAPSRISGRVKARRRNAAICSLSFFFS